MKPENLILQTSFEFRELMRGMKKTQFVMSSDILQRKVQREIGDFFALRPGGLVTFCPTGRKQEFNEDGKWTRAGRNEMKAAKFLKKIFSSLSGQECEQFATKAKSLFANFDIEILPSSHIESIYANEKFDSCMTGDPVGEFYKKVGAQIMVIRNDDGEMCGRAIVWPRVQISGADDIKVIDRIYATEDAKGQLSEVVEHVRQYAEKNGYYTKQKMSYYSKCLFVDTKGNDVTLSGLIVPIGDITGLEYYPYVDTFTYTDGETGLCNVCESPYYNSLDNTDGSCEGLNKGYVTLYDGTRCEEDNACMVGDSWYHIDDCVMCHHDNEWILLSDSYQVRLSRRETIYIHSQYVNEN